MKENHWYFVYSEIGRCLAEFEKKCIRENKITGEELFRLLTDRQKNNFWDYNVWVHKFEKGFDTPSLDPIHIFASFSGNRTREKNRISIINEILRTLESELLYDSIDFTGCPFPPIVKVLSARPSRVQQDIWEFFIRIYENEDILQSDFEDYKNWYGIEFSSITIFLFWIKSSRFLPIDRNVRTLLVARGIVDHPPKNFIDYQMIINNVEKYIDDNDYGYGSFGLFREIAHLSYEIISHPEKKINMSNGFRHWQFNTLIDYPNKILKKQPDIELKSRDEFANIGKEEKRIYLKPKIKQSAYEKVMSKVKGRPELGIRLIAIKVSKGEGTDYNKILKQDDGLYYFDQCFSISGDEVNYDSEKDVRLYDLRVDGIEQTKVNISAIVGTNGSGKSTAVELLFAMINNCAFKNKAALKTVELEYVQGINAEMFYILNGILYKIICKKNKISLGVYSKVSDSKFKLVGIVNKFDISCFDAMFYTIAVNYSHYALNEDVIGTWIRGVFHKNDAYQTPLVINPMRTNGNININREFSLVTSRLISNLFAPLTDPNILGLRQITPKQVAFKVNYKFKPNKGEIVYYENHKPVKFDHLAIDKDKGSIFTLIKKEFGFNTEQDKRNARIIRQNKQYILGKLARIGFTYAHFEEYYDKVSKSFVSNKLPEFIEKIKSDNSHITHKLKSAIHFWKYPELWEASIKFSRRPEEASDEIRKFQSLEGSLTLDAFLPPPIFEPTIILIDADKIDKEEKNESDFNRLSSGEQQFIHSISSILYHLRNLDSVEDSSLVKYRSINLLLDEIELYYHPDLQRKFIHQLLKYIGETEFSGIDSINICLVTHSPYILSDIPNQFTLKLDSGISQNDQFETFGANIHDLLTNEFFLRQGYMGAFAKETISNLANKLVNIIEAEDKEIKEQLIANIEKKSAWKLINVIGEPMIKNGLRDTYFKAFGNVEIKKEIQRLKELMNDSN